MNAVIPSPAASAAEVPHGELSVTGPWHIRADPALLHVADAVGELLAPHLGSRLLPMGDPGDGLVLRITDNDAPPATRRTIGVAPAGGAEPVDESYGLSVHAQGITCRARTPEGAFRAATTAAQLLITAGPEGRLPRQRLDDAPHYAWRGLMLDPARSFLTPDEVRRVIDLAALYKLNVLHLHLTDNEGWRLEIPSTPLLTSHQKGTKSFYTVEDYRSLQDYAARRHVTVIPEIDLPGHCAALRAALPTLPPAPAPEGLAGRFPFTPPLDLTDAATHAAVSAVLADVCALTDGSFVHVGADEALGATEECFAASVRELRDLVRKFGKSPVAWQESSRAGLAPGDIVQFWVDVEMMDLPDTPQELAERPELLDAGYSLDIIRALKQFFAPTDHDVERILAGGGRVLLSPQSHLYLDRPYDPGITPPESAEQVTQVAFPGYRPRDIRHASGWDPAVHAIPEDRIAGVEATLFAERLRGIDDVTTFLLPRLGSVAEAAWSGRAPQWEDYRMRLGRHARMWRERGLPYFPATDVPWQ